MNTETDAWADSLGPLSIRYRVLFARIIWFRLGVK